MQLDGLVVVDSDSLVGSSLRAVAGMLVVGSVAGHDWIVVGSSIFR